MIFVTIPMDQGSPWFTMRVVLSGVRYTLDARYNTRMQRWLLDIGDASGAPIAVGLPLLIDRDLTGRYPTLPLPPGLFLTLDSSGRQQQPTLPSFALDHILAYGDPTV